MLFLLDANVLIDANRDYYPIDCVPEFWDWLVHQGEYGNVKRPIEIYEELTEGNDILADWTKNLETKTALLLDELAVKALVQRVIREGYADDLTDV
ncbi:MAG: DUF4411 family protein [Anaerolineales bacterium]|nr:DUF4411 family protein [Anaerolineales bacterium]